VALRALHRTRRTHSVALDRIVSAYGAVVGHCMRVFAPHATRQSVAVAIGKLEDRRWRSVAAGLIAAAALVCIFWDLPKASAQRSESFASEWEKLERELRSAPVQQPGNGSVQPEQGATPASGETDRPAAAEPHQTAQGKSERYEHNGSIVQWLVSPSLVGVRASYLVPRAGVEAVGVTAGTVLFEGTLDGQRIVGRAFAFKRGCPPAPYDVSGAVIGDRIILRGAAPVRSGLGCGVTGYSAASANAELVFNREAAPQ
jgi:hypothetical protein